jgi:hypothetical protein
VRLGLRNRIVVDSLRDHRGFATAPLVEWAAQEFAALADREEHAADRLREQHERPPQLPWIERDRAAERRELRWRESARRATAAAFRALVHDERRIIELVEQARIEAWQDVAGVIMNRVDAVSFSEDPAYATERSNRMAELVALDLSALAIERGVPLS